VQFVEKIIVTKACKKGRICTIINKKACLSLQPLLHKKNMKRIRKLQRIRQKSAENKQTRMEH